MGSITKSRNLHGFKVIANGVEIGKAKVHSLSVSLRVNRIPTALLFVVDGDAAKRRFDQSDLDAFAPGKEITIKMGYDNKPRDVFKGIVVSHSIKARRGKSSMLCLELQHEAVKMAQVRNSQVFDNQTDKQIVTALADKMKFGVKWVEGPGDPVQPVPRCVQYNVSNWDFLVSRAEASGKFVYFSKTGDVEIKTPQLVVGPQACKIEFGDNVYDFEASFDARNQYSDVVGMRWDYEKQEFADVFARANPIVMPQELGSVPTNNIAGTMSHLPKRISYNGHISDERLMRFLDSVKIRSLLSKIRGGFVIKGMLDIAPGDTVSLSGFSKIFNGYGFVSGITHKLDPGDWRTEVEIGVSPDVFSRYNDVNDEPVAGLIPAIEGLHIGTVHKREDPAGLHRVEVRIPHMSEQVAIYARVLQSEAGDKHGTFYFPEVGDEVLVGFLNNDPCNAVVLGAFYSVKREEAKEPFDKSPPFDGNDQHNKRGILTPKQIKVELDDDNEAVTIETPDEKKIVIDASGILLQKADGELISITDDGITLETSGTIKLKAGKIELVSETGDITANANNVSLHGKMSSALTSDQKTKIDGSLRIDIG